MKQRPTYLRVVLTSACPMFCPFCHHEGLDAQAGDPGDTEPAPAGAPDRVSLEDWKRMLEIALASGIKKVKFLGGEALVSPLLPALVAHVKQTARDADVSIITSGAASVHRLKAAFDAGLDRANLSIHGWTPEAFARNGTRELFHRRKACLDHLLERGRPLKLNYVYTGPEVEEDLEALIRDLETPRFAGGNVVLSILDDLSQPTMSPDTIRHLLERLRGTPVMVRTDDDPNSLQAERWYYRSGLVVEIKSSRLSEHAPWRVCPTCHLRRKCREGTFALRLDPDGRLRYCMDRPDLGFSLLEASRRGLVHGLEMWRRQLERLLEGESTDDYLSGPRRTPRERQVHIGNEHRGQAWMAV